MTAGQEFVKKIGPFGSALFIIMFIAFLVICFLPPKDKPAAYYPPNDSEYYAQNEETLLELKAELEENFFPKLEGGSSCELSTEGTHLIVRFPLDHYQKSRTALLKHYDAGLFEILWEDE